MNATQYFWENHPNGNQLPPTRSFLLPAGLDSLRQPRFWTVLVRMWLHGFCWSSHREIHWTFWKKKGHGVLPHQWWHDQAVYLWKPSYVICLTYFCTCSFGDVWYAYFFGSTAFANFLRLHGLFIRSAVGIAFPRVPFILKGWFIVLIFNFSPALFHFVT